MTRAPGATGKNPLVAVGRVKPPGAGAWLQAFTTWCKAQRIELRYIQPGKPDQNGFIERFNRR